MTVTPIVTLRLMMPPDGDSDPVPLRAAWCDRQGAWQSAAFVGPEDIAARFAASRLEICPHPADISMTVITLPPLRPRQQHLAVSGAVELLALTPPQDLAIGHGLRGETGVLPVAWMAEGRVAQLLESLHQAGLQPDAILPPPAFLPQPEEGCAVVRVVDGWAVVRSGASEGGLYPLVAQGTEAEHLARLQAYLPAVGHFVWPDSNSVMSGDGWTWGLPLNRAPGTEKSSGWQRPACLWGLLALVVWLGGLTLEARKREAQGLALKQQMTAQVKAAFPGLTVVINPLQQARQLREARDKGTATAPAQDFATLLRAASALLPRMDAQVQQLSYRQGVLDIRWRDGAALRKEEAAAMQAHAGERQVTVVTDGQGVKLSAAQPVAEPRS